MRNDTPRHETPRSTATQDLDTVADDPALSETAVLLDRLAQAERDEPDAGFESRLIAVASPGVVGRIGHDDRPAGRAFAARSWWMLPVAAALVLGVVWVRTGPPMGQHPGSGAGDPVLTLAAVEADLETFLFIDEFGDDQVAELALGETASESTPSASDTSDTADEWLFELLQENGESL